MDPALITALTALILGVLGSVGAGIKWLVPFLIERGKTKKQTDTRVKYSGSLVLDQADTIEMLKRQVARRDEIIDQFIARYGEEALNASDP